MTVRVGMRSVVSSARWTVTLCSSTSTTDSPSRPVTPRLSSERSALAERLSREGREDRDRAPRRAGCAPSWGRWLRKSPRTSRAISAIWPAISTPVGPAPTTTKVKQLGLALGVGLELGRLEGLEDLAADGQRALERLQLGRVLLPFVVAEVGVLRAAGDDQRVVLERLGRGAQRDVAQARRGAPRGRRRPPRRGRRARCAAGGRCAAAGSRSRPARSRPWPPGRRAAGRGGSCGDRPA